MKKITVVLLALGMFVGTVQASDSRTTEEFLLHAGGVAVATGCVEVMREIPLLSVGAFFWAVSPACKELGNLTRASKDPATRMGVLLSAAIGVPVVYGLMRAGVPVFRTEEPFENMTKIACSLAVMNYMRPGGKKP